MAEFLSGYGEGEERRSKIVWRSIAAVAALLIVAAALYFTFRGYSHKRRVESFLEQLGKQNYQAAYQMWGCTPSTPCRDYPFDRFMEDWGPNSPRSILPTGIKKTKYCGHGVIAILDTSKGEESLLWVESKDMSIGFAPWPVCNPMYKPVSQ
jgi:hypothetical protein